MKPTIIPHPLKRIHISYHTGAALSDFAKAFIQRYKQLHDELAMIRDQLLELGPEIRKVIHEFSAVRKSFDKLHRKISITEQMLGLRPAEDIDAGAFRVKPGEITDVLNEFQEVRKEYWDLMVPMHNHFNAIYTRFSSFDEIVERFEKEFSHPLLRQAQNMEIDVRSFTNDMNEFRMQWMAIAGLQDTCLDEYTAWAKLQTTLVNDSGALYDRIKKLFQHISNLQKQSRENKENDFGMN